MTIPQVLQMVNDILWLHYPLFYLSDGAALEGVSYSYMSIEDSVDLAALQLASFGAAPAAISESVDLLEGAVAVRQVGFEPTQPPQP
jgi:hypothetical protein